MPRNRLKNFFANKSPRHAASALIAPAGFVTVPTTPLMQISVDCQEKNSLYEMAYLLARTGYVVEK